MRPDQLTQIIVVNRRVVLTPPVSEAGSGVIVEVVVNDRAEHEQIYVQKTEKTFSQSPCS